jgi:hypothetical protein
VNELDSTRMRALAKCMWQPPPEKEQHKMKRTYLYPSPTNSASTLFPASSLRSQIATQAPARTSAFTIPSPIPATPPVTNATLPFSTLKSSGFSKSAIFVPTSLGWTVVLLAPTELLSAIVVPRSWNRPAISPSRKQIAFDRGREVAQRYLVLAEDQQHAEVPGSVNTARSLFDVYIQ